MQINILRPRARRNLRWKAFPISPSNSRHSHKDKHSFYFILGGGVAVSRVLKSLALPRKGVGGHLFPKIDHSTTISKKFPKSNYSFPKMVIYICCQRFMRFRCEICPTRSIKTGWGQGVFVCAKSGLQR